jgi:glycosyltransferase involved in cell wall biosynthesis
MRVLHAIHDFVPRHRAGSEIYACELARQQSGRHDVFVVAAEYDPSTAHGTLRWRTHDGLTVVELVNNWEFRGFSETYSSPRLNAQLEHVLDATAPDVLHVHNLLNLSVDLPSIARARGIRIVATLHDYTLVCVSGGQRVHLSEGHVCGTIDPDRCSRCFAESAFSTQLAAGRLMRGNAGRAIGRAAATLRRLSPGLVEAASHQLRAPAVAAADIRRRLAYVQHVFDAIDLFVAPSGAMRDEFVRLGVPPERIVVSDYGFAPAARVRRKNHSQNTPLQIGFVGTLVWHKGAHVLLEAAKALNGAFELHLHGDLTTFPTYVERLRETARTFPVAFHGSFDRESLPAVYGNLDVLVVPSLWPENSPLVIHEAFMHGVPVIGARTGGIPGLVTDGLSGLLYDAFSTCALAEALQRVIDDRALLRRLSSSVPCVKSIAEDAREWDARYAAVVAAPAPPGAVIV